MAVTRETAAFAAPLIRAMTEQGIGSTALAAEVGCDHNYINTLRRGEHWPSHVMAVRLAEALMVPRLAAMSLERVQRYCDVCGRGFLLRSARGKTKKRCSKRCTVTANRRNAAERDRVRGIRDKALRERVGMISRVRLTEHQEAVAAFCRACEPEGLCRTATCELRPVSPLPLVARRVA